MLIERRARRIFNVNLLSDTYISPYYNMNHIAKNNDLVRIVTKSNNHEVFIGTLLDLHDIISLTNDDTNINNKKKKKKNSDSKYDCTLFINEHPLHKAYGLHEFGCVGICLSDIDSITRIDEKDDIYQKKIQIKNRGKTISKGKALEILERFKTQTELSKYMVGEDLAALEYAIKTIKEA